MLALAILVGSAIYSIHSATLLHSSIGQLVDSRESVQVAATVTSDCKVTRHKVYGSRLKKPSSSFLARTKYVEAEDSLIRIRVPIRILGEFKECVNPGDQIKISGRLISTREKRVAGTLIAADAFDVVKPASKFAAILTSIRLNFRGHASKLGGDAASLIPGMVLGDTALQREEFSLQMRRAGLSHLTAVSGANFAIVSALVFFLLRRLIPKILPRICVTTIFLLIFLLLVRPSPSVLRAGVMAAVVLLAKASGNTRNSVAALATAITALLLLDPFQAVDPGFVLSVLATSGLIFIAPLLTEVLERYLPQWLAEMVSIPCAATITCTPYIIFLSGEISILSVVFNLVVAPVVAPITILGFIAVLMLPIPVLTEFLLLAAKVFAQWIVLVSQLTDHVPSWGITPMFLLIISVAIIVIYLRRSLILAGLLIFFVAAMSFAPRVAFPGSSWKVLQCDVGQGDALLVNLGRGSAILFDAGPDSTLLRRCLSTARVHSLPLVVVSHGHADHYFGLRSLAPEIRIGSIWSNGSSVISELTTHKSVAIERGFRAVIGEVTLEALWPDAVADNFSTIAGDGSAENNKSLVLLVSLNGVKLLVTGDIEPEVQSLITRQFNLEDIDILKVPHHGSRFQDSKFLDEISPKISLVSVGLNNTYGHPSAETLQRLAGKGSRVLRTDRDGPISVAWRFDDSTKRYIFTMKTMRKEWWRIQWR